MTRVVGIDLGGSSLRAGVVDADGALHQVVAQPHRIGPEADPEDWWRDLRRLLGALDLDGVSGIGLSGIGRSQVFADAAGRALRPAICFSDARAVAEAAALGEAGGAWAGMSAFHPAARIAWVRHHEPAVFAATRHVLQPKDWLALRLTGAAAGDRIGGAWALAADGRSLNTPLLRAAGAAPAMLPAMREPWEMVGRVQTVPALAGVAVFAGSLDTWCATLGAGVGEGDGYVITGTTDAAGVLTATPLHLPGRVTLGWGEGLFHTGGPSGAGGACLDWFAGLCGLADARAVATLAGTAPARGGPMFLPDLDGIRAPLWQAEGRGVFLGLAPHHDSAALARAVLEGVALADAAVLAGTSPRRVVLAGGGARSDVWCAIRAGILGGRVARAAAAEPGVLGAALTALIGLGALPGLAAARAVAERGAEPFVATPEDCARGARLLGIFNAARDATRASNAALAACP